MASLISFKSASGHAEIPVTFLQVLLNLEVFLSIFFTSEN